MAPPAHQRPPAPPHASAGGTGHDAPQAGRAARKAAALLIGRVLADRQPLAEANAPQLARLAPEARARALRLAQTALRHLEPADTVLAHLLRKPPPAPVQHLLRLAVVERFVLGAPAHALVNDAVAITRAHPRTGSMAGMVNAVLRRALAHDPGAWAALPAQRLPDWLRRRLIAAWGAQTVAEIEHMHRTPPPVDLTPRDVWRDPDAARKLAATLDAAPAAAPAAAPLGAEPLPTGSLRLRRPGQLSALPGYAAGRWWVQDAAAALPARLLMPRPGEPILDLCAAPGGKTQQLASAGAEVTALDISPLRMARLRENLLRTGLAARLIVADALEWRPPAPFAGILLDAPCTATGTIRRHPDLPFLKGPGDLEALVALQARLLDRALGWLRPGGRLVFATCSLLPDEGEDQARAALARHPGLRLRRADTLAGVEPGWITPEGGLRLRPDHWAGRGGMDGFYMACFERPS